MKPEIGQDFALGPHMERLMIHVFLLSCSSYHLHRPWFVHRQVLAEVDNGSTPYSELKGCHDTLEHTFWLLGRSSLIQRHLPLFSEESVYKLFRVFCLLAERKPSRKGLLQVRQKNGSLCRPRCSVAVSAIQSDCNKSESFMDMK